MATISLCLIAKNEGHRLDNCLSTFGQVVDEIILVDTGSTDNTKEIARKLSKDYDVLKVTSWKECKDIMDNVHQN